MKQQKAPRLPAIFGALTSVSLSFAFFLGTAGFSHQVRDALLWKQMGEAARSHENLQLFSHAHVLLEESPARVEGTAFFLKRREEDLLPSTIAALVNAISQGTFSSPRIQELPPALQETVFSQFSSAQTEKKDLSTLREEIQATEIRRGQLVQQYKLLQQDLADLFATTPLPLSDGGEPEFYPSGILENLPLIEGGTVELTEMSDIEEQFPLPFENLKKSAKRQKEEEVGTKLEELRTSASTLHTNLQESFNNFSSLQQRALEKKQALDGMRKTIINNLKFMLVEQSHPSQLWGVLWREEAEVVAEQLLTVTEEVQKNGI